MKSEEERPVDKISYEKPTAIDLGPTAPVVGASCVEGWDVTFGLCYPLGNGAGGSCVSGDAAGDNCWTGNSAISNCGAGDSAGACGPGASG